MSDDRVVNPHIKPTTFEQMVESLEWMVANEPVPYGEQTFLTPEAMLDLLRIVAALKEANEAH
jgi:hypothetical protein